MTYSLNEVATLAKRAARGAGLPSFVITRSQMRGGTWEMAARTRYGSVTANWGERAVGQSRTVRLGAEEPELTLRHRYASEVEAKRAALKRSQRGSGKVNIELCGFNGALMAEGQVLLQDIKPELSGAWTLTSVTHTLSDTLTTRFEATRDPQEVR